jgi:hypothetical protein
VMVCGEVVLKSALSTVMNAAESPSDRLHVHSTFEFDNGSLG